MTIPVVEQPSITAAPILIEQPVVVAGPAPTVFRRSPVITQFILENVPGAQTLLSPTAPSFTSPVIIGGVPSTVYQPTAAGPW
jgi:hypothetical protein